MTFLAAGMLLGSQKPGGAAPSEGAVASAARPASVAVAGLEPRVAGACAARVCAARPPASGLVL